MVKTAAWVADQEREEAHPRTKEGLEAAIARGKTSGCRRSRTDDQVQVTDRMEDVGVEDRSSHPGGQRKDCVEHPEDETVNISAQAFLRTKKETRHLTEDQYRELFETIGIEARELRHVLRYRGPPRRVYFNRNRYVGIYFSADCDDEAWYPSNLWEKLDSYRIQKADHGRLNVAPRPGMATGAFRNLVRNWQQHDGL